MAKLNLTSPWVEFYHKLQAFFKNDPAVTVIYDEDENEVKLYVDDGEKAEALETLLPETKTFGNVDLKITIIPSNGANGRGKILGGPSRYYRVSSEIEELFVNALRGNKAFMFSQTLSGIMTNPLVYIIFRNEVVQYWNDDLGDYYGQCSTLYQDIARDIFEPLPEVHYCTEKYYSEYREDYGCYKN